jgi:hypothetical protein
MLGVAQVHGINSDEQSVAPVIGQPTFGWLCAITPLLGYRAIIHVESIKTAASTQTCRLIRLFGCTFVKVNQVYPSLLDFVNPAIYFDSEILGETLAVTCKARFNHLSEFTTDWRVSALSERGW